MSIPRISFAEKSADPDRSGKADVMANFHGLKKMVWHASSGVHLFVKSAHVLDDRFALLGRASDHEVRHVLCSADFALASNIGNHCRLAIDLVTQNNRLQTRRATGHSQALVLRYR